MALTQAASRQTQAVAPTALMCQSSPEPHLMAQRLDAINHRLAPLEHAALGPHKVDLLSQAPFRVCAAGCPVPGGVQVTCTAMQNVPVQPAEHEWPSECMVCCESRVPHNSMQQWSAVVRLAGLAVHAGPRTVMP